MAVEAWGSEEGMDSPVGLVVAASPQLQAMLGALWD